MVKEVGLVHYIRVFSIFLMLTHLFLSNANYSNFSTTLLNTFHHFEADSHKEGGKTHLKENNITPIKCSGNYCSNFSSFFTASFATFRFNRIDQDLNNRFFLYDDPPYSSFFNSIWIPPKINGKKSDHFQKTRILSEH